MNLQLLLTTQLIMGFSVEGQPWTFQGSTGYLQSLRVTTACAVPQSVSKRVRTSYSMSAHQLFVGSLASSAQQNALCSRVTSHNFATAVAEVPTGMQRPDATGRFGKFGGKYVPETLITALAELEAAYAEIKNDPQFQVMLQKLGAIKLLLPASSASACRPKP